MPNLVVIGGGNSTPIFATLAKTAGWHVTVLTRKPDQWSLDIGFINEDSGYIKPLHSRAFWGHLCILCAYSVLCSLSY